MTVTPPQATGQPPVEAGYFDVVIVAAGISGIGTAYRIAERNPHPTYAILERRAQIGGPGTCSAIPACDQQQHLHASFPFEPWSFPFEPWTRKEGVADGADIR